MEYSQRLESLLRDLIDQVRIVPPDVLKTSDAQKLSREDEYYTVSLTPTRGIDINRAISLLRSYYYESFYQLGDQATPNQPFPAALPAPNPPHPTPTKVRMDTQWHRVNVPGQDIHAILLQKGVNRLLPGPGECISEGEPYRDYFSVRSNERRTDDRWQYFRGSIPFVDPQREVRFYFNLAPGPDRAAAWASCLQQQLEHYQLPFELKYWNDGETQRCDRGVLYVSADHAAPALVALRGVYEHIRPFLHQRLPLFVRPLRLPDGQPSGIGFAESPDPDPEWGLMSFGQACCHRIAREVLAVFGKGYVSKQGKVNAGEVLGRFGESGLKNFYQQPGSAYVYPFHLFEQRPNLNFPGAVTDPLLSEAAHLGYVLSREAIWLSEKSCTWIGTDARNSTYLNGLLADGGLTGRQGAVLFLKALHKEVSDPLFEATAEAAETGTFDLADAFASTVLSEEFKVQNKTGLFSDLRKFLQIPPPNDAQSRAKHLESIFRTTPNQESGLCRGLHLEDWAAVTKYGESDWYDLVPGLDGLALLGFSYLYAYDPALVQDEVLKAVAEL